MTMLLSQIRTPQGVAVVARDGSEAALVKGATSVRELALEALASGRTLAETVAAHGLGEAVDLVAESERGMLLAPIDHPDPAHLHLTGTGLTHLGSASTRSAMHAKANADDATDSIETERNGAAASR